MKIARVYIDTSVIGGCFEAEFALWSNGLVQDFLDGRRSPVLSELVLTEIQLAPDRVRGKLDEILGAGAEVLGLTDECAQVAESYLRHGALPAKYRNDALHIALASVADVDVLVSWNFKHIVHIDRIRLFNAVNLELGYKPLQIYSPREVSSHGAD